MTEILCNKIVEEFYMWKACCKLKYGHTGKCKDAFRLLVERSTIEETDDFGRQKLDAPILFPKVIADELHKFNKGYHDEDELYY